jgi:hypothetical protein
MTRRARAPLALGWAHRSRVMPSLTDARYSPVFFALPARV